MQEVNFFMDSLRIADNIVRLRRQKQITQEQLADFVGVTKASVSKWETGLSHPDIMMLPRLASFFGVTVDELLGYRPYLTKEQIQKLYQDFAADFASRPFEEVMEKTQTYVRQYYSCYPFLFQVCALWLNHYTLTDDPQRQTEILNAVLRLCGHIRKDCKDIKINSDTIFLQSLAFLQLGRAQDVICSLEEISDPSGILSQSRPLLVQAYMMSGDQDKAERFTQAFLYNDVMSLIEDAVCYLSVRSQTLAVCEETIARVRQVAEAYRIAKLNPNAMASFEYQAMLCYLTHGEKQEALSCAGRFVKCLQELFAPDHILLHGDAYFDRMDEWFCESANGCAAPRSRLTVLKDIRHYFDAPVFAALENEPEFKRLKKILKELT